MLGKHCGIESWPHCPHQITSLKLAVTDNCWIGHGKTLKFLPKTITFLAVALVWWSIQASAFFSCMCFLWHLPGSDPTPYNLQMAHQKALPSNISCILTKQLPYAAFLSEPDHPSPCCHLRCHSWLTPSSVSGKYARPRIGSSAKRVKSERQDYCQSLGYRVRQLKGKAVLFVRSFFVSLHFLSRMLDALDCFSCPLVTSRFQKESVFQIFFPLKKQTTKPTYIL